MRRIPCPIYRSGAGGGFFDGFDHCRAEAIRDYVPCNGRRQYFGRTAESAFAVTDSKKIVVKENEPLTIRFNPDEGFRAASVLLGTAELAGQIKDGLLTTPGFTKEETVTVTFTETAAKPSNRPSTPAVPDPPQGGGKPVGTGAASAVLLFPCMLASGCIVFFCRKGRDGTDTFS